MKTFISWSGERSQALGQALHEWLPMVLHYVDPWLSHSDIDAGQRWADVVGKELEARNFGIICVTRENVVSPWMLFEAGALAKSMQEGRVIPLLLDLEFKDISGPLAQFQAKKIEKAGILDVLTSINNLSEVKVPETRLSPLFDTLWPSLESKIASIPKVSTHAKQNRPQHEVLEELVSSVRGLDMRFRETSEEPSRLRRRRPRFHPMMVMDLLRDTEQSEREPLVILVMASVLKDDFPWLYELGMEAYREARGRKSKAAQHRFLLAVRALRHSPLSEMIGDKETYMMIQELEHMTEKFGFSATTREDVPPRRPPLFPKKASITESS